MQLKDYDSFPDTLPLIIEENMFLYLFMIAPLFIEDEQNKRAVQYAIDNNKLLTVAIKIQGIQHEFTTIPGVIEDVTDIVLNLKQVRFAMTTDEPQKLRLIANEKGEVKASAIQENQNVNTIVLSR